MSSTQNYMLNLVPCTVQGRPLSVMRVLCNLAQAKAKQD